jgi:hypothetical protein
VLEIIPYNLHCLYNSSPENDWCVYGGFTLTNNDEIIIAAANEVLTLSAAVIFLFRTIEKNHSFGTKIYEQLIPKCADMYVITSGQVGFINCPFGIDWWVEHSNEKVTSFFEDNREIISSLKDHIRAVLANEGFSSPVCYLTISN